MLRYTYIACLVLVWFLLTHCRCKGLLLHLITLNDTHTHTHTLVSTPLDDGLVVTKASLPVQSTTFARYKYICPRGNWNTQFQQASDLKPSLRQHGHWNQPSYFSFCRNILNVYNVIKIPLWIPTALVINYENPKTLNKTVGRRNIRPFVTWSFVEKR
jgi:hypothetical protein